MKYSALTNRILPNLRGNTRFRTSKNLSVVLYGYDNILLKTYIDVASNQAAIESLIISGSPTKEQLIEAWEGIVKENSKHSGDHRFDSYEQLLNGYAELIASQTIVCTCLEMMTWKIDFAIIKEVRDRGYAIETTTSEAYAKSLESAKKKARNLITRAEMKRKDIERQFGKKDNGEVKAHSFQEIIGMLELALDRSILDSETLTLSKYNTLKKGAEDKHKARIKNERTSQGGRSRTR